jgi:Protein of unknown function (DUF2971)
MILYKYLQPARVDVLKHKRIRFTQPGDFNDPFEFRPKIRELASDAEVRGVEEERFEQLIDDELTKYGALTQFLPQPELKRLLAKQKPLLPALFRLLEPAAIRKLSPMIDGFFNLNVGILCLSEVRDSILMWGHYTDNHRGLVVGFDSDHPFFSRRRSDKDEFGFLRRVDYSSQRPQVMLTDTESSVWFSTKSEQWSYEKEWRIVRVLSEAEHRIDGSPFPICLFEFAPDVVLEIIVGMRSPPSLITEIQSLAASLPRVQLFIACEDPDYYSLLINRMS